MDFTREPIIESIVTPKEGCKIVVRSSKSANQEEYFVDAIEVVSFGNALFYRSLERPKAFLVPASDYEILEVREARMVLKGVGADRSIKIAGGKEIKKKKEEEPVEEEPAKKVRPEKKRERRRQQRRRRGKDELSSDEDKVELPSPETTEEISEEITQKLFKTPGVLSSLLPPPPKLISETIEQYKENERFRDVFYTERVEEVREEEEPEEEEREEEDLPVPEDSPKFGTLEEAEADEAKS